MFLIVMWPVIGLVGGGILWYLVLSKIDSDRIEVQRKALQDVASLSQAYAQYVGQVIAQIDQIALRVKHDWERSHAAVNLDELAEAGIFRGFHGVVVSIVDSRGALVAATEPGWRQRVPESLADSGYFVFHSKDTANVLLVGKPSIGSFSRENVITFTRRLEAGDRSFDGVVVLSVDPRFLTSFYAGLSEGKAGFLALVGNDGTLRAARSGGGTGPVFREIPLFDTLRGSGALEGKWFTDDRARYTGWETLTDHPLVAMAGLAEEEILAPHRTTSATYRNLAIGGSFVLTFFAFVSVWLSARLAARMRHTREMARVYRLATERGPEGLYILDPLCGRSDVILDFVVADCNERGAALFGYDKTRLAGLKLSMLFRAPEFDAMMHHIRSAMISGFYEDEVQVPTGSKLQAGWARRRLVYSDAGLAFTLEDISGRKRAEQVARIEHLVTATLAESETAAEAIEAVMRALCEAEDWDLAEYWQLDGVAGELRRSSHWMSPGRSAARAFVEQSRDTVFKRGVGLVGVVCQSAEPLWVADTSEDPRVLRKNLARGTGIRGGLLVPILASGRVIGVLEFASRELRSPDERLRQALRAIGHQIGQFVQRKRAEEALHEDEERLNALVESALEAIIVTDFDQRIVIFNHAAEIIFSYRAAQLLGTPLGRLIPERYRDAHSEHMRRYAVAGTTRRRMGEASRITGLRADGSEFPADASIARFTVGGKCYLTVMLRDVSEQVRTERELREVYASLERRVAERTVELEAAMRDLESFGYSISHDLRAPARAVAGLSRVVIEDYGSKLPEKARHLLMRVAKAGETMGAMVTGLLELYRVARGELVRQPVDLIALAREVWRELSAAEPGRHVALYLDDEIWTQGDPLLLRSLLMNLLGNARKYSRGVTDGGVWLGRQPDGAYYVRDNGVGFDMAHAAKLFGAFQRLHTEREFEGHGIGLALCKKIVERHGGRIWAESEPGKGATFYFTLGESV